MYNYSMVLYIFLKSPYQLETHIEMFLYELA